MPYYGRMNTGRPVFAQLMSLIHPEVFHRCVARFSGQERLRSFSCWDQFLCMAFGQLTFRDSLRDTVDCLCARSDRLYQMGFRGPIRRSTLADANEQRDWRIYAQLAQTLIRRARRLYAKESLAAAGYHSLRARLHYHRPVPESVSLGQVPTDQGCH